MKKLNHNLVEEEDSIKVLENFISVHSQEDEKRLAEIWDILPKRKQILQQIIW